jgi:hypothetical protein
MTLYEQTVPNSDKSLENMERWIDEAIAHPNAKKLDPNSLLTARLAPDPFPLARQVGATCDHAKFTCARLAGKEAPSHPDNETTLDELKNRIRSVREYIKGLQPSDFEGAEERKVTLSFVPGKDLTGTDELFELACPNSGFHLVHVYALLRHNGVDLGKKDFIPSLPFRDL